MIDGHAGGAVDLGCSRKNAVAIVTAGSTTRDSVDDAVRSDFTDAIDVADVKTPSIIDRQAPGTNPRGGCGKAIATGSVLASAGVRGDQARWGHLAYPAPAIFADVEVSFCIKRQAKGLPHGCRGCRPPIARTVERARARDRGNRTAGSQLQDAIVVGVGDMQHAARVQRYAEGCAELSRSGRGVRACDRADDPAGGDLAHSCSAALTDVQIASLIQR